MKLDDPRLSSHHWLLDAVREGLKEIRATELASFPVESRDQTLERLLVATDLGLIEGTLGKPPLGGMPSLTLDLRLWRDVRVSARIRVEPQHGAHWADVTLDLDGRAVSTWSNDATASAAEFAAEALAQAAAARR